MHAAGSQASSALPICDRCGVIAPSQDGNCELCQQGFGHPRPTAPSSADGSYWVAVRCSFQCRSCHFLSPLDSLDIDGSVECAQCGMPQRFDVKAWHEALAFAHEVGDLGFPAPRGVTRTPRFGSVTPTRTSASATLRSSPSIDSAARRSRTA